MDEPALNVFFIHGLFSSGKAWGRMLDLIKADQDLASKLKVHIFEYLSPKVSLSPLRRVPTMDTLADALGTFIETQVSPKDQIFLVAHSQGGLIAQRYLVRELADKGGESLQRVRGLLMFASPNAGSEFFLSLRRSTLAWRHPQERELRPLVESVTETQRTFLRNIVFAHGIGPTKCPIPVWAYAGQADNVVPPASAMSVFPNNGVLPGDHFSIIRPDSLNDARYQAFARMANDALEHHLEASSSSADMTVTPGALPVEAPVADSLTAWREIVRALLEVNEFIDLSSRREILGFLPKYITTAMPSTDGAARIFLMALVRTCDRFGDPGRLALLITLDVACPPEDQAVQRAISVIKNWWNVSLD